MDAEEARRAGPGSSSATWNGRSTSSTGRGRSTGSSAGGLAMHVRDWGHAFREFRRVLVEGGWLVFSAEHPADVFHEHHPGGDYFEVERVSMGGAGSGRR